MKAIIERALPLTVKYTLVDKKYIPIEQSMGAYCCNNCGKLISNIATVKNEIGESFNIGFDCLETILINNNLLDGKSIEEYREFKRQLPAIIKKSKEIYETIKETNAKNIVKVNGIQFDKTDFQYWSKLGKSSYLTFHYLFDNGKKYNSNIRVKSDINLDWFFETFKALAQINLIIQ